MTFGSHGSTRSAAAGGVTTIIDMPFDAAGPISSVERFEQKRAGSAEASLTSAWSAPACRWALMTDASQPMPYESSTSKQPFRVDRSDREPHTTATAGICAQDTEQRRFPWVSFVNMVHSAPGDDMKYLLLLYDDSAAINALAPGDRRAMVDAHIAYAARLREIGAYVYGDPLDDPETGGIELETACQVFQRLGARPDVERVRRLIDSAESGLPRGLTAREVEVLNLVATGRTNREISSTLMISEHTVARHLQNIFGKIGVSLRTAATTFALEHNLISAHSDGQI